MWGALTTILGSLFSVIDKVVEKEGDRTALKAKLQEMALSNQLSELEAAANIIVAEAKGESWLQRNWRPILMLTITLIVANNYLLVPYLEAVWGVGVVLDLPKDLWDLMTIGVGGYVGGRSVEKVVDTLATKANITISKPGNSVQAKRTPDRFND